MMPCMLPVLRWKKNIVPGGGVAYIRASAVLDKLELDNEDRKIGVEIVRKALEAPIRTIVDNAGIEGSIVVQKCVMVRPTLASTPVPKPTRTCWQPGESSIPLK